MKSRPSRRQAAALIVAHPGHELRVHGWLERARPLVFVLTDGSGHTGQSRLASTAEVLRRAGARPGCVFGRFSDRALYEALIDRDLETLQGVARELADALVAAGAEHVAGDAIEGFNPGHDLCRVLADAAVALAGHRLGRPIASHDFLLDGRPDAVPGELPPGSIRLDLDDGEVERKLAAAAGYPEMREEVERNLAEHGAAAFRSECFRPAHPQADLERFLDDPPWYESHGERQVAAGHYDRVLRFREHFLPMARALRELGHPA
jgi:hypothetical protein